MNTTLSTFLKFAITAVAISAFLFGVGYTLVQDEASHYESEIEAEQTLLP